MTDSKTDAHGAVFVTANSEDPRFKQPYIDVREWRDEPADAPVFAGGAPYARSSNLGRVRAVVHE